MKPTTGHKKTPPTAGSIAKEHDLLASTRTAELEAWIDEQLSELEARFADFTTNQSAMTDIAIGRA